MKTETFEKAEPLFYIGNVANAISLSDNVELSCDQYLLAINSNDWLYHFFNI